MISMGNNTKPNNQIVGNQQINEDLQLEAIIEENAIHDSKFPKTLQRHRREIKFPKRL